MTAMLERSPTMKPRAATATILLVFLAASSSLREAISQPPYPYRTPGNLLQTFHLRLPLGRAADK